MASKQTLARRNRYAVAKLKAESASGLSTAAAAKIVRATDPVHEGFSSINEDVATALLIAFHGAEPEATKRDMKNKIRQGSVLGKFKAEMYLTDPTISDYQPTARPKQPKVRSVSKLPVNFDSKDEIEMNSAPLINKDSVAIGFEDQKDLFDSTRKVDTFWVGITKCKK